MSKKMASLIKLRQREQEQALKVYMSAKQSYLSEVGKLEQLELFRDDYNQRVYAGNRADMNSLTLQNLLKFIGQLDTVIVQQHVQNKQALKLSDDAYKQYLAAKQKTDSLLKINAANEQKENLLKDKQAQKESDEYASIKWYSDNNNN